MAGGTRACPLHACAYARIVGYMVKPAAVVKSALRRTRIRLKAFAYSGPARGRWQHPERVIEAVGLGEGARVADLGAGGGYFTVRLARAVGATGRVFAVDPDADMVLALSERAIAQGLDNVVVVEAPEDDPALPEPVDLVLFVNSLHHLPDPPSYVRGLAAYLRPGGRVAIVEALPRWYMFGHATDPQEILSMMTAAGYTLAAKHDGLPRQSFQVFERPGGAPPAAG
jgi:SAM-dependent methyltransferase